MTRTLLLDADGRLTDRVLLDDARLAELLMLLNRDGEEARVVGGAVRNALLGLPLGDVDITTTATPDAVTALAKAARLRVVPTGLAHGTVTVLVKGMPFEVTTLREDIATDGRHAVVRFGRDFAADARRRDFTINGLSMDAGGVVHDYAGGLADLGDGRVRFIGDAVTRIREDYLRVLRFFRFSARYATGPLDPESLAACAAESGGLARLSRERVRAELFKLFVAERAVVVMSAMAEAGVLAALLGAPLWPERQARLDTIERATGIAPDPLRTLAALALSAPGDVGRLRDALRLSNDERDRLGRIALLQQFRDRPGSPPDALAILGALHRAGREAALDIILLDFAASGAAPDDPAWQGALQQADRLRIPDLRVSGADVMARGLKSGPLVGAVLKDVQARWIRAGFPEEPVVLHRLIDESIAAMREPPRSP